MSVSARKKICITGTGLPRAPFPIAGMISGARQSLDAKPAPKSQQEASGHRLPPQLHRLIQPRLLAHRPQISPPSNIPVTRSASSPIVTTATEP